MSDNKTFKIRILQADRPFYEGECESLVVPTTEGQYGILANHRNLIGAIVPGMITYKIPGKETEIASVSNGIVKVEDNEVLILVNTAEHPDEVDANKAKRQADEAREILLQKRSMREYRSAQATLARAIGRLKVKNRNMGNDGVRRK